MANYTTHQKRMRAGYTDEEARAYDETVRYTNHYYVGDQFFPNIEMLSAAYGIRYHTLWSRLNNNYTPEQAVAYPAHIQYKGFYHWDGTFYPNQHLLADAMGIDRYLLANRIGRGMSLTDIHNMPTVTKKRKPVTVAGIPYASTSAAARAHGVETSLFVQRLDKNWTPEQAAGIELSPREKRYSFGDYRFKTVAALARTFNQNTEVVRRRLNQGATPAEAVDVDVRPYHIK